MSEKNFLNLPYSQRQLVIVQPDEVVAATKRSKQSGGEIDWKRVASSIVKSAPFYLPTVGTILELSIVAYQALNKARESGLNIVQIGQTQALELKFPPGHPREQTLYVAHPAMANVYYTMATFHRMAFEHKFSEAVHLLMALGATKIKVEHIKGWSREFSAKIGIDIPQAGMKADAGKTASNASSLLFEANLNNQKEPALPENLVWYPHESTWQAVANGRINFGLEQFSLTVNYEDDFSVNAGTKLKVEKAGLELGGNFENHTATTWKISGEFGSPGV